MSVKRERSSWVYTLGRGLAAVVFRTLFPIRFYNTERLSINAPFIVVCNHQSLWDPIVVAYACKPYEIRFIGKKELMANKLMNWLICKQLHAISVDRHHSDMAALRSAMQVIKDGHVLGIFPEGTRHVEGTMEHMEGGTAMIALRCGVPVVPVWIDKRVRLFRRTNCRVGETIDLEAIRAEGINRETCDKTLEAITNVYHKMIAEQEQIKLSEKK